MDKYYNVWYIDLNRWTNHLGQDPNYPKKMSLQDATALANILLGSAFEVREIHSDGITSIPMASITAIYYNVWHIIHSRWTNHNQSQAHPKKLTLDEAKIVCDEL